MQRENNDGGRDESGRFGKGNSLGFERGKSGNPAGRPRSALLTDALRRKMLDAMPDASEKTVADGIADALIKQALNGDVSAIKEVFDRTEGKISQRIDASLEISDWQNGILEFGITADELLQEAINLLSDGNSESISE